MKSILISVLGDDKPGLLDSLSEIIVSNDGDWIESNMSTVEAKFASILRAVSYTHLTLPTICSV